MTRPDPDPDVARMVDEALEQALLEERARRDETRSTARMLGGLLVMLAVVVGAAALVVGLWLLATDRSPQGYVSEPGLWLVLGGAFVALIVLWLLPADDGQDDR